MECRERRTKFETHLMSERKKIEVFRLRETKEFLSIDELREKCETSDQFMDILKVNIVKTICEIQSTIDWINFVISRNVNWRRPPSILMRICCNWK